eukprot:14888137-Ditylum_brightwellii.AAC.2
MTLEIPPSMHNSTESSNNKWKHESKVLVLVDANSGVDKKDFASFISEAVLCNAVGGTHGINTHNTHAEGSKAIDFMLCSPNMLPMIKKCGMLWFYNGIYSDNRGLFCDINILHLLCGQ